jgi:PKD domain-containing protein
MRSPERATRRSVFPQELQKAEWLPFSIWVTVTDTNNFTSAPSATVTFTVDQDPSVSTPSSNPSSADVGQTVVFSASVGGGSGAYIYNWSGLPTGCAASQSAVVSCRVTNAGATSVRLNVSDYNGESADSGVLDFSAYADPGVAISSDRAALDVGQTVELTAVATLGSGGYSFLWADLPKGCSGTLDSIQCSPSTAGRYPVSVKVTDSNGLAVDSSGLLLTVAFPLSSTIAASSATPTIGDEVTFTSNVSGGTAPLSYAWTFGDGATGTGPSVNHTYESAGSFAVTLLVNDSAGASMRQIMNLSVSAVARPASAPSPILETAIGLLALAILAAVVILLLIRRRTARSVRDDELGAIPPAEGEAELIPPVDGAADSSDDPTPGD